VDGAEFAVRAVVGQQISTAAARTHAAALAAEHGREVSDPDGGLTRLFPSPDALAGAELRAPARRRRTLRALTGALADGRLELGPAADREKALRVLDELPGIGPWTREVIAMRSLGDPDAFPATDLGVRRGAEALGLPAADRSLLARAAQWQPWRAYAVQHLWAATPHTINRWPAVAAQLA
jgi:AraC family transcriptional regulator of adaptative response / DNA-3-methyladenine glycosylase II